MAYTWKLGMRYLRSKKRKTISVITFIAVAGVALGVAALVAVLAITSGFQEAFRNKVLGVNAHVLVMKYGVDFDEYRDVMNAAEAMEEVRGVGPFLINEMMLAEDDRLSGVLVKGIDPERMPEVLDLPDQLVDGNLRGLRREGARPPTHPDDLGGGEEDWEWLEELTANDDPSDSEVAPEEEPEDPVDLDAVLEELEEDPRANLFDEEGELRPALRRTPAWEESGVEEAHAERAETEPAFEPLPEVEVASPEEVEALLGDFDPGELDFPADPGWEEELLEDDNELARQEEEGLAELPGIVVGHSLARSMGMGVGDRVRLVSPLSGLDVSMLAPGARTPRSRDFRVIAIFEAGFQEYDTRLVYTDLFEAQHFYGQGDAVTGVEMRLHDLDRSAEVARRLERDLGGPFHTLDWAELNRNLFTALKIQKVVLGLVIAIIIVVAAFNVIATLIMIVLEKKREIAILKAMGARNRTILGVFMLQGLVIGVIGTAIGLLIGGALVGYLATYQLDLDPKVYLIDHLPVVVDGSEFLVTSIVAMAICIISTIVPSLWAANMLPVDGLRYE